MKKILPPECTASISPVNTPIGLIYEPRNVHSNEFFLLICTYM